MSDDEAKNLLEQAYLTPTTQFSSKWLDRLQIRWKTSMDYCGLIDLPSTRSNFVTRFIRDDLEGSITGYREECIPITERTAKNSMSILRKPGAIENFVHGVTSYFPFTPGGLDDIEALANAEDEAMTSHVNPQTKDELPLDKIFVEIGSGLLDCPPGFKRGLKFASKANSCQQVKDKSLKQLLGKTSEAYYSKRLNDIHNSEDEVLLTDTINQFDTCDEVEPDNSVEYDDIDALLPDEFPSLAPHGTLPSSRLRDKFKEWAHMVDVNQPLPNFNELVPELAKEWPFELDNFQKEAIYRIENGDCVFVAAHTSAGKTVVAEYAIALAAKHITKAIYTSPIKALSNQKFRDFRKTFTDVGILTGDVQINPEASCLIMTTEILRSMLYKGADIIRDVEFVIFDEVHYVNDLERGVVWEEVIIMLPEHVTLILLSATVPNTYEFASWIGRTKKKNIYVISTAKRPVPLEFYLWTKKSMHKIVSSNQQFLDSGWKQANDILTGRDKIQKAVVDAKHMNKSRDGEAGRGRGGIRRGGPTNRSRGNIARTGRGGARTTAAQDRGLWMTMVQYMQKENLLPACIFVFSKKRCEENAESLSTMDLCSRAEKNSIHIVIENSIARLNEEDRNLPQIQRLRDLLNRGFAVHHGGMLPILKELVEILFAQSLVKVLFATETFAMGLNLPTRTVVFSGFRKHDGRGFRDLLPGEVTQMAGRAGRRGLDTVGTVIFALPGADEAPASHRLRQMILGTPSKLKSQFRLTYIMILNLLRVESLKIEEMIKRSFSENATQSLLPEHERLVKRSEEDLERINQSGEKCTICHAKQGGIEDYYELCVEYERLTRELHRGALESFVGRRNFSQKRLIVFKRDGVRSIGLLARDGVNTIPEHKDGMITVLEITGNRESSASDALPFHAAFAQFFGRLPCSLNELKFRIILVEVCDVERLTKTTVNISQLMKIARDKDKYKDVIERELLSILRDWNGDEWNEVSWDKIRKFETVELVNHRDKIGEKLTKGNCLKCDKFVKHFIEMRERWWIKENINELRSMMSDENLQLLPDYQARIEVLKKLGFVDRNMRITLKGKVACEIHSGDELVITEFILENVLGEYEAEEVVALLSCFVFHEKSERTPNLKGRLKRGQEKIIELCHRVDAVERRHLGHYWEDNKEVEENNNGISENTANKTADDAGQGRVMLFGLVEVVYEWARGTSFEQIMKLTDVMEGTIVRVITRLGETCREVSNAARIIGDPELYGKMQECQEMIHRDVCAVASLYV